MWMPPPPTPPPTLVLFFFSFFKKIKRKEKSQEHGAAISGIMERSGKRMSEVGSNQPSWERGT